MNKFIKWIKLIALLMLLPILGACNSGTASATANAMQSQAKVGENDISIQYSLDGEILNSETSNLHDMGWHLLTFTVMHYGQNAPQSGVPVNGINGSVDTNLDPVAMGQTVTVKDINCQNAVFTKVGDSCSAYVQISYDWLQLNQQPCVAYALFHANNLNGVPGIFTVEDDIQPAWTIGNYRAVHAFESQYYTGESVSANPAQYRILLMQNGSLPPIHITTVGAITNPTFTLMHRTTESSNDPYYGAWDECNVNGYGYLRQQSILTNLNASCILVYQAATTSNTPTVSENTLINTDAQLRFPYHAESYTLQATYGGDPIINWHSNTLKANQSWTSIAYGNGVFVAVGGEGTTGAYFDGISWYSSTLPFGQWNAVTYGNGKFVAVSYDSNIAAYSSDGINWTQTTLPASSHGWNSVAYSIGNGNGKFVAVSYDSNIAAYSSDGINWTQTTLPLAIPHGYAITSGMVNGTGRFVLVGWSSNVAAYSLDGINWNSSTLPASGLWSAVTYGTINGNGIFVAINNDGSATSAYSYDGINWTASTMPSGNWSAVTYGGGMFLAVSNDGGGAYSLDGIHWQTTTMPSWQNWTAVAYGSDHFVTISYGNAAADEVSYFNLINFVINSNPN